MGSSYFDVEGTEIVENVYTVVMRGNELKEESWYDPSMFDPPLVAAALEVIDALS